MLRRIKRIVLNTLYRSSLYPGMFFFPNPFKALEMRALLDGVRFSPDDVGLDIGSGIGVQTGILATHMKRVVGIDPSQSAVLRAESEKHLMAGKGEIEYRCATIESADFADAAFDKVFSICVLEHIPDHMSVLQHAHRVLKPGGHLAFSVDSLATITDADAVSRHRAQYKVVRYFTPEEIRRDFEGVGFRNVRVRPVCTSKLAAKWFTDGIRRNFIYRYLEGWWMSFVLRWAERWTRRSGAGVYLIIHADR